MSMADTAAKQTLPVAAKSGLSSAFLWALAAWLAFCVREMLQSVPDLANRLGDTDDATRLTEVREWLAGAGWFNHHTSRFGLEDGLLTHWSRLIDAGFGGLIRLFGLFLLPEQAEIAARAAWPLLVLLPMLVLLTRAAGWRGGPLAAALAAVFAFTCQSGLVQFTAGRIDHHNVMILGTVGGILLMARSIVDPRCAIAAGLLTALGLAIGYEGILLLIAAFGLLALLAVTERRFAAMAARVAGAAAAGLVLAFLAAFAPERWLDIRCDGLSLNLVAAAVIGAGALALMALPGLPDRPALRFALLTAGACLAAGAYGWSEPACLAGPFGQVDPAIKPIWLDQVTETLSVFWLFKDKPAVAVAYLGLVGGALACEWALGRTNPTDPARWFRLLMLAIAATLGCWQLKLMPYASFLAVPSLAVFGASLETFRGISAVTMRLGFVVLANQATLLTVGTAVAGAGSAKAAATGMQAACTDVSALRPLAALPPGLIVAPIDLGPYLVAITRHTVLAAPYHRLSQAILTNDAIWSGRDMETVGAVLRLTGAAYVVDCLAISDTKADVPAEASSLRQRLKANDPPPFLEAVPMKAGADIRVWRVRSSAYAGVAG